MSTSKPRLRRAIPAISATLILLALSAAAAYAYFGAGLRAYVVETPSMGTYAPVGTLVISKPATQLPHVGESILFKPSGQPKTYFHRVTKVESTGVSTAGDLTHEQDPWLLTRANLQGVEIFHLANAGWLFKASPMLALGALLLGVYLRFFCSKFWRVPSALFGISTIFSVANYVLHPFVQATLLDKSTANGIATIRFVNTGIVPLDVHEGKLVSVLQQGELFVGHAKLGKGNSYSISSLPHLELWQLLLCATLAAIPSIVSFAYYVVQRRSGGDYVYVPVKNQQVPEGQLVNQSDQITIDGKVYPKYITEDFEAQEYWLKGVENLTNDQLAQRLLAAH